MIPIIVATHGGLARELITTAQLIVGVQRDLTAVCLEAHEGIEDLKRKFEATLASAGAETGHLVLVDMFGGTPSNVALELAQSHPLRVITGVNLPMLLEVITHRPIMDLPSLAEFTLKKGRQSIFNANDLFPASGRSEG